MPLEHEKPKTSGRLTRLYRMRGGSAKGPSMAAIVSRVGQGLGRPSTRKNRVARVSAKAAQRSSPPRDEERDAEIESVAGELEIEPGAEVAVERKRADNTTYLSMYFRD